MSRRQLPVLGGPADPAPALPTFSATQGLRLPDRDELSTAALELLSAARDALLARPARGAVFSLEPLEERDRGGLWEMLGEGEVSITVQGTARYEIDETALPGLFRVRTRRADGDALHLEVGAVPAVVVAAAEGGTSAELPLESPPPAGLMNALPLLAELRHRMRVRSPGELNHVISLTLLPLCDADREYLARALGVGPVEGESRGYGTCRIATTARRGIWTAQHHNAMDTLILDTLEVGGVPAALVAAAEDLEDSGARLAELLDGARAQS